MAVSQGDVESLINYFRSLKPELRPTMRGAPSELTAPTRRHMFTAAQILDPETSQLFIDIEGDVLTGGQDFLQSSVQQECFRADRPSARLCLDGPRSNCALLRHCGACVRVTGGHADRKRWLGLEMRQWCCPGKKLAGSGLGPSRFLRRRTARASGHISGATGRIVMF